MGFGWACVLAVSVLAGSESWPRGLKSQTGLWLGLSPSLEVNVFRGGLLSSCPTVLVFCIVVLVGCSHGAFRQQLLSSFYSIRHM